MKNRIFAILVVILMCFSMITPVFAAQTDTQTTTEWTQSTIQGPTYDITYWHPVGYPKIAFANLSGSSNEANYYFLFYNDDITWVNFPGIYENGTGIAITKGFSGMGATSKQNALNNANNLLFGNYDRENLNVISKTSTDGTDLKWSNYTNISTYTIFTSEDLEKFESHYVDWYFSTYGFYPPLAGSTPTEDVGFMNGQYYAIFSQEAIGGDDIEDGNGRYRYQGYVDTVAPQDLKLTTMHEIDGEKRGLVYVVISSDTKGDLIGFGSLADEGIFDWLTGALTKVGLWLDIGDLQRNNYDLTQGYIFYNKNNNVNRYYFSTIQDACKFVLYGTAGAEPLYSEFGQTDYGYGYISCEFSNYDMNGHPAKTIPMEQYPMGRQEIILAQHDVKGEGRKFVYIDLNYYSRVSMVDPDYNLIINNEYMLPNYASYIQEKEDFNPKDKLLYKVDETYKIGRTTTFPLYYAGMEDDTGTWDIIYSTYSIFIVKEGQIIDGDEFPPVIENWTNEDGQHAIKNNISGEVYVDGNPNPYTDPDGDGIYHDKDGNEWNPNDGWTNEILDWQQTINKYQDNFEKLADLIEDFTGFINSSTEQVGEITDLLNAVMLSFPSIFRTLILFSFMALIFGRIIRRK